MYQKLKKKKLWVIALIIPLVFSCSGVMLIGAYNANVDQSIQLISKDISTLFVGIEKNIQDKKDFSYDVFRDSYIKIEGEISSCETIANGIPKYDIISQQLDLLQSSVQILEKDHKSNFVNPDKKDVTAADIIKSVELDKSGITTSLQGMLKLQEGLKREKAGKLK